MKVKHTQSIKLLKEFNEELSPQLLNKSGQKDMYYPLLKMEHQSFAVFQLVPSMPRIVETGSGLLPTVTTMDMMEPKTDKAIHKEITVTRPGRKQLSNLRDVVVRQPERLLPTITSETGRKSDFKQGGKSMWTALKENNMLPTPTASSDAKGGCTRTNPKRQNDTLAHAMHSQMNVMTGKTSQLNPRFVAEMMGFPPNWTELPFQSGEMKV